MVCLLSLQANCWEWDFVTAPSEGMSDVLRAQGNGSEEAVQLCNHSKPSAKNYRSGRLSYFVKAWLQNSPISEEWCFLSPVFFKYVIIEYLWE